MSTFDFNNNRDCQGFIALILDDYCPTQLEGIDALIIGDAIKSCKENNIELTGNSIYYECCLISINNLISNLNDIKEYDLENFIRDAEMTEFEAKNLKNFLDNTERFELGNGIFECWCNGSLDSSIFLVESNITEEDRFAMQKLNEVTECFSDFQDEIGGYVRNLDELLQCEIKLEVNEPDICD